jgi:hypothetical protein
MTPQMGYLNSLVYFSDANQSFSRRELRNRGPSAANALAELRTFESPLGPEIRLMLAGDFP